MTKPSFEETLIEVWRQALVENAKAVKVGGESYPVRQTPKRGLREGFSCSTSARFVDWSRMLRRTPVSVHHRNLSFSFHQSPTIVQQVEDVIRLRIGFSNC